MNADITIIGPRTETAPDGASSKSEEGAMIANFKSVNTDTNSKQDFPKGIAFPGPLFGRFDKIADSAVEVSQAGSEMLELNGESVSCDILKVSYTPSTYEHPHPEQVSYWISRQKHLVLKRVFALNDSRSHLDEIWTVTIDSIKFTNAAPQWFVQMKDLPEVTMRKEWIGKPAPQFSLPADDGSPVKLASLRGKVVLLDFWSIACGPCKLEMPAVEELGRDFHDRGVDVLGISFDPAVKSKGWLDKNHDSLRNLTDDNFVVSDAYKVEGIPALVLIGRDGKVQEYWQGTASKDVIEAALKSAASR